MRKLFFSLVLIFFLPGLKLKAQFRENQNLYYDISDDVGYQLILNPANTIITIGGIRVMVYELSTDMLYVKFKNDDQLFVTGQYMITDHVFQRVGRYLDADTDKFFLEVDNYKYPLKTGLWLYNDRQDNLIKQEVWKDGILQ